VGFRAEQIEHGYHFAPLDRLFGAEHLAVIGASADPDKIGGRPLRYLDAAGFAGSVYPVNPKYDEILGRRCTPTVAAVGQAIDVAVIAVPGAAVEGAIDDCVAAQVPFAIVFSSGFGELGAEGRERQNALVARARAGNVRLVGPNSLGIASSPNGLMASFATLFDRHERLLPGSVGFISQSGALGVFMYALAQDQGLGFSRFVSIGNESDLDVADFLAYMAGDPATSVVGGYLEGLDNGQRFMAAAELVRRAGKPMSFLKVGRSDAGRRAAESHTGSLAGTDAVYDVALRQAGVVRSADPQGLIDFLEFHGRTPVRHARRGVAVLTISGGAGVWCADRLADFDVDMVDLAPKTIERLRALLPAFATPQNPVDATGQVLNEPELFAGCLEVLLADPSVQTLIIVMGLQERGGAGFARQIVEAEARHTDRSIVVAWLAGPESAMDVLRAEGVPVFSDLARAVEVVAGAVHATEHIERSGISSVAVQSDLHDSKPTSWSSAEMLGGIEHAAKHHLAAEGIDVPDGRLCVSLSEGLDAFEELGPPVALKGQIAGLAHKTEHQLVSLGLSSVDEVTKAYEAIERAIERAAPPDQRRGVLVEAMSPPGLDIIAGCFQDDVFGPTVMVGSGGVLVELVDDVVFRIAPVTTEMAAQMLDETRAGRLFGGYRSDSTYDRDAAAQVIARLSEIAVREQQHIRELEINPLRVHQTGAVALDALVTFQKERE
jgi:acetyltransferase